MKPSVAMLAGLVEFDSFSHCDGGLLQLPATAPTAAGCGVPDAGFVDIVYPVGKPPVTVSGCKVGL
jgi:hypothetical protein